MSMFPLLQDLGKDVICSNRGALLCPGSPCSKTLVEMLFALIEVPCCIQVPPAPRSWWRSYLH